MFLAQFLRVNEFSVVIFVPFVSVEKRGRIFDDDDDDNDDAD